MRRRAVWWWAIAALALLGTTAGWAQWDPEMASYSAALSSSDRLLRLRTVKALAANARHEATDLLCKALGDVDPVIRATAAGGLAGRTDPIVVAPLLRVLDDKAPAVRAAAAAALAKTDCPDVLAPMLGRLGSADWDSRRLAAQVLGALGDPRAGPRLRAALDDHIDEVAAAAARALGELGDAPSDSLLLEALEYRHRPVQLAAAEALGRLHEPRAIKPIARLLETAPLEMAAVGAMALSRIGTAEAVPPLLTLLGSEHARCREAAATALGCMAENRVVLALLPLQQDSSPQVQAAAKSSLECLQRLLPAEGLVQLLGSGEQAARSWALAAAEQSDCASPELAARLAALVVEPDPALCRPACRALVRLADVPACREMALGALRGLLSSEEPELWPLATLAVGRAGDRAACPGLIRLLDAADADRRRQAVETLGMLGSREAVRPLTARLRDVKPGVRAAAIVALARLRALQPEDLERARRDREGEVRAAVANAVAICPDLGVVDALPDLAGDEAPEVRAAAIESLGALGRATAVTPALIDKAGAVRAAGLRALARTKDPRAAPLSLRALADPEADVRLAAAEVLGQVGRPVVTKTSSSAASEAAYLTSKMAGRAYYDRLRDAVAAGTAVEQNVDIRFALLAALANEGDGRCLPQVLEALEDPNPDCRANAQMVLALCQGDWVAKTAAGLLTPAQSAPVRRGAAMVLASRPLARAEALPALVASLQDSDRQVRLRAAAALGEMGDSRIEPLLLPILQSPQEPAGDRLLAIVYLGQLRTRAAYASLTAIMRKGPRALQPAAATALGRIGNPGAVESLLAALAVPDHALRAAIAGALASMPADRAIPALITLLRQPEPPAPLRAPLSVEQMSNTPPRLRAQKLAELAPRIHENAALSLRLLTKCDFGANADAWQRWWAQRRQTVGK